jgi:hypothetical protein
VYLIGDENTDGFFHVTIEDSIADLRLAAIDVAAQRTTLGVDLYAGTLCQLQRDGVRQAVSKISAANTSVMNVYAMLGFRFSLPETVFHWHAARLAGIADDRAGRGEIQESDTSVTPR